MIHSEQTSLDGILLLHGEVFCDDRGSFAEAWNRRDFERAVGRSVDFVQENFLHSFKGVLRGLHYQAEPMAQAKLVTVLRGVIYDVVVDIRTGSPTRGRWLSQTLTAESRKMMWIPEGFAHGFCVVSETADVLYKVSNYYSPEHERRIRWDDRSLAITWPLDGAPVLSEQDAGAPDFAAVARAGAGA